MPTFATIPLVMPVMTSGVDISLPPHQCVVAAPLEARPHAVLRARDDALANAGARGWNQTIVICV